MTDLSSIFRSKTLMTMPATTRYSVPSSPFISLQQSPVVTRTQPKYVSSSANARSVHNDFSIPSEAKKIITFDNMQDQALWFESQNLLECLSKILLMGIVAAYLYWNNKMSFNTSLSFFIFVFLLFGLQHNIFGASIFRSWVYYSFIGTTIVFSHQLFLYTLNRINPQVAGSLYYTYESLIPSIYITALVIIIFHSLPILSHSNPGSFLHSILNYPRSILQLANLVYKLKISIIQTYAILLICTFCVATFWIYTNDEDYERFQELFSNILHPYVLLAQFITFFWVAFVLHFILGVVSVMITNLSITLLYNKKNRDTKVPIILELLRISPSDTFFASKFQWTKSPLIHLVRFFKMDFSLLQNKQKRFSREELENIYKHSLAWLNDLLHSNPQALKTRITTSKFYHTYFDIFKQFSQAELSRCSNSLFELNKQIESLTVMKNRPKSITQDLFFWPKVLSKLFTIWTKAILSCRHLRIMDHIIEIISQAQLQTQLWSLSSIGRDLQQINERTEELITCNKLNPVIRQKMEEYYNKTSRILKR